MPRLLLQNGAALLLQNGAFLAPQSAGGAAVTKGFAGGGAKKRRHEEVYDDPYARIRQTNQEIGTLVAAFLEVIDHA
jgi:hypothetical protein